AYPDRRIDRLRSDSIARSKPDAGDHRGQCAPTPRHRQTPEISAECAEAASRVRMVTESELRLRSPGLCSCCYCKHSDGPRQNDSGRAHELLYLGPDPIDPGAREIARGIILPGSLSEQGCQALRQ